MTDRQRPEYETRIFSLSAVPDRQNEDIKRLKREGWEMVQVIPNANEAVFRRKDEADR